jgi:hypothetical protein
MQLVRLVVPVRLLSVRLVLVVQRPVQPARPY